MSLINDALKKAQKLQTQQPAASKASAAPAGTRPAQVRAAPRSDQLFGFERILVGLVALVVLVVGVAVGTVLLLRKGETPVVATAPHPAVPVPAVPVRPAGSPTQPGASVAPPAIPPPAVTVSTPPPPPAVSEPTPPVAVSPPPIVASSPPANPAPANPSPAATPLPDSTPPVSSAPPSVSVDLSPEPPPATTATPPPAQGSNLTPPAAKPAVSRPPAPPKQDFKILAFIDKLKILGIRAAGSDSKVLMSGRVYRLNEIVDYELGLRLTGVGTTTLTFVDESGVVYSKGL
jgi:hypothetical protein